MIRSSQCGHCLENVLQNSFLKCNNQNCDQTFCLKCIIKIPIQEASFVVSSNLMTVQCKESKCMGQQNQKSSSLSKPGIRLLSMTGKLLAKKPFTSAIMANKTLYSNYQRPEERSINEQLKTSKIKMIL